MNAWNDVRGLHPIEASITDTRGNRPVGVGSTPNEASIMFHPDVPGAMYPHRASGLLCGSILAPFTAQQWMDATSERWATEKIGRHPGVSCHLAEACMDTELCIQDIRFACNQCYRPTCSRRAEQVQRGWDGVHIVRAHRGSRMHWQCKKRFSFHAGTQVASVEHPRLHRIASEAA